LENYLAIKPQSFVEKSSLVVEELQFVQWDIFIWATLYMSYCKRIMCNNIGVIVIGVKIALIDPVTLNFDFPTPKPYHF